MDLPRVPLIISPTPLHSLPRLSEELAIDLWIKRDDLTGFAMGGNKGRKLEYIIADAIDKGADTVVTCGSLQSNFIRQLAAACAMYGLSLSAAVMTLPFVSEEERPHEPGLLATGGNVLLDELLGVDLHIFDDGTWDELYGLTKSLADRLRASGHTVYEVPVGGSSALGAFAFYQAGLELQGQTAQTNHERPSISYGGFDWILFASSSGSTHTGLAYAFHESQTKVIGIACDPEPDILDDYQALYEDLERLIGERRPMGRRDWRLSMDFVGPGYGVPSEAGGRAIRLAARREGIFLDPIYTAKAFAGLLSLAGKREIGGRVLFWHTGGLPALFATA